MTIDDLYKHTCQGAGKHNCESYYCTTCGGQSNRVQKAIERLGIDQLLNELQKIDIRDYLSAEIDEGKRQFLKHLIEGADWGSPMLPEESIEGLNKLWQSQATGNEYRSLDQLFQFNDYGGYTGRDDHFDLDAVMSKHQGRCYNRDGITVHILSTDSPGEFPVTGRVVYGPPEGEIEEYRCDGSHSCDWISDLVMPED